MPKITDAQLNDQSNQSFESIKSDVVQYMLEIEDEQERYTIASLLNDWLENVLFVSENAEDDEPVKAKGKAPVGLKKGDFVEIVAGKYNGLEGTVLSVFENEKENDKPIRYGKRPYPQVVVDLDGHTVARYFGEEVAEKLRRE